MSGLQDKWNQAKKVVEARQGVPSTVGNEPNHLTRAIELERFLQAIDRTQQVGSIAGILGKYIEVLVTQDEAYNRRIFQLLFSNQFNFIISSSTTSIVKGDNCLKAVSNLEQGFLFMLDKGHTGIAALYLRSGKDTFLQRLNEHRNRSPVVLHNAMPYIRKVLGFCADPRTVHNIQPEATRYLQSVVDQMYWPEMDTPEASDSFLASRLAVMADDRFGYQASRELSLVQFLETEQNLLMQSAARFAQEDWQRNANYFNSFQNILTAGTADRIARNMVWQKGRREIPAQFAILLKTKGFEDWYARMDQANRTNGVQENALIHNGRYVSGKQHFETYVARLAFVEENSLGASFGNRAERLTKLHELELEAAMGANGKSNVRIREYAKPAIDVVLNTLAAIADDDSKKTQQAQAIFMLADLLATDKPVVMALRENERSAPAGDTKESAIEEDEMWKYAAERLSRNSKLFVWAGTYLATANRDRRSEGALAVMQKLVGVTALFSVSPMYTATEMAEKIGDVDRATAFNLDWVLRDARSGEMSVYAWISLLFSAAKYDYESVIRLAVSINKIQGDIQKALLRREKKGGNRIYAAREAIKYAQKNLRGKLHAGVAGVLFGGVISDMLELDKRTPNSAQFLSRLKNLSEAASEVVKWASICHAGGDAQELPDGRPITAPATLKIMPKVLMFSGGLVPLALDYNILDKVGEKVELADQMARATMEAMGDATGDLVFNTMVGPDQLASLNTPDSAGSLYFAAFMLTQKDGYRKGNLKHWRGEFIKAILEVFVDLAETGWDSPRGKFSPEMRSVVKAILEMHFHTFWKIPEVQEFFHKYVEWAGYEPKLINIAPQVLKTACVDGVFDARADLCEVTLPVVVRLIQGFRTAQVGGQQSLNTIVTDYLNISPAAVTELTAAYAEKVIKTAQAKRESTSLFRLLAIGHLIAAKASPADATKVADTRKDFVSKVSAEVQENVSLIAWQMVPPEMRVEITENVDVRDEQRAVDAAITELQESITALMGRGDSSLETRFMAGVRQIDNAIGESVQKNELSELLAQAQSEVTTRGAAYDYEGLVTRIKTLEENAQGNAAKGSIETLKELIDAVRQMLPGVDQLIDLKKAAPHTDGSANFPDFLNLRLLNLAPPADGAALAPIQAHAARLETVIADMINRMGLAESMSANEELRAGLAHDIADVAHVRGEVRTRMSNLEAAQIGVFIDEALRLLEITSRAKKLEGAVYNRQVEEAEKLLGTIIEERAVAVKAHESARQEEISAYRRNVERLLVTARTLRNVRVDRITEKAEGQVDWDTRIVPVLRLIVAQMNVELMANRHQATPVRVPTLKETIGSGIDA
ncbi:MAG: hypothetical protein WCW45_03400 [Patescibacteria group bacterium]